MGRLSSVSVLFADCRGFTQLIHERGPEEITPLIDEFFRQCSNIIVGQDGILDNFRGDAVLAFFNVPIRCDNYIARAVTAATQIQLAVPHINVGRDQKDLLKVGVGITAGMALTATVGSDECKDYTVMGDTVNIASRIQGLAEPGMVLVSDEVYEAVKGAFPNARERTVQLKGISHPITVYSLT